MSATLPGANPASLPPAILGQRYRLERKLAQGGMAEVWLGTDLSLTRQVAVKLLKSNLAADPIVAERFRREAIAVAQLTHPNIVAVYDAIDDKIGGTRRQAVVMQLVDGKSLRQLLDEQHRLSPDLTMHIGMCVGAALDCAHRANLVHRDIKPGNILITLDGRVLLTDFGIAKGLDGGDDLTSPNVMMGTAKYLSPEQVRGRKLDGRADLYSLGLVLYECLAGRVPFLGETDADTALARLNRDPTHITRLRPTLPQGLPELIHRLLALRPADRFATGAEMRSELQRIAGQPKQDYSNDTSRDVARGTGTPARGRPAGPALSGATTIPSATGPGSARRSTPVHGGRTPTPVGGYQPRPGRPAGSAVRADRTPTSTARPRQQPNRKFEHRAGPSSIVVGILLVTAFIVALVLWVTIGRDEDPGGSGDPQTTVDSSAAAAVPDPGSAAIVSVRTFDPNGSETDERDDLIPFAFDGNVATAWTTLCYSDRFMSGKPGVGLIADLGAARSGTFTAVLGSAPYQVKIYAAGDGVAPATFAGWGAPLDSFDGQQAETISVQLATPARFVLVAFNELGVDSGCTSDNDYRGSIQEMYVA